MPYKDKEKAKESKRASYLRLRGARPQLLITERYSMLKYRYKGEDILSIEEFTELVDGEVCHYCGGPLSKHGIALDRMDNTKGHLAWNCVPCCGRCNYTFGDYYTYAEKLLLAETIKLIDERRRCNDNCTN
jgi:5-methylcytosine-specific restriction endonuclease McrA